MIFNKGGHIINTFKFYCRNAAMETVKNYTYLGIDLTPSGNFKAAISKLKEKVLFKLRYCAINGNINIALKLF